MKKNNLTVKPPTGAVRMTGQPVSIVRQTHESRSLEAIELFETELVGTSNDLNRFLLHYFCCDVLGHLIQGRWIGLGQAKSLTISSSINISQVTAALKRLRGPWKMSELDTIFHTKTPKDSARLLRNAIVHSLDKTSVNCAHSKIGAQRVKSMRRFIDATKTFIDTGGHFMRGST